MKRLIRKNQRIKCASFNNTIKYTCDIDSFDLDSGDIIALSCRVVNNKPWFQVYQEGLYNTSSYYDGDDYDRAAQMYADLLSAFKGVTRVEAFTKKNNQVKSEIEKLVGQYIDNSYNYETLKKSPLFLGMHSDLYY